VTDHNTLDDLVRVADLHAERCTCRKPATRRIVKRQDVPGPWPLWSTVSGPICDSDACWPGFVEDEWLRWEDIYAAPAIRRLVAAGVLR
jgi:hypothetical protein